MSMITSCLQPLLSNQRYAIAFFSIFSATALIIAMISQYGYGLQPCDLCIYQRIPYAIIAGLGILYFILNSRAPMNRPWVLGLMALLFLIEAVIAFYHSGVERKWWPSFLEGCTVPKMEGNITDVLARIAETPVVRCDEIPWTDPIIGLSMANYNVIVAAGLFILALYSFRKSA